MSGNAVQVAAGLRLDPALPWWALALLALAAAVVLAAAGWRRARGTAWRAVAMLLLLGWLCGPTLVQERRTPLADIVLLAVDQSASMQVGNRPALVRTAQAALAEAVRHLPGVEMRTVQVPDGRDGTALFAALDRAMAGVPRERLSAVLALSDGQVHDVPADGWPRPAVEAGVPFHLLLPARGEETDRRLRLLEAPGYGVVGKTVTLRVAVDDLGPGATAQAGGQDGSAPTGAVARLVVRRDGETPREQTVPVGVPTAIELPVTHEGPSVVELTVDALPGEVSTLNNRAVAQVTGVRDRLRVLLISGEPHAGERTWRRLLKADPAVDLVHFTILRPPEKDDLTPLNELALIAFPTRELFQQKVREFDLIILDRFQNRGILPLPYLRNIAEYVRLGGGLLVSVGPEFAGGSSLDDTPLTSVLPAHAVPGADDPGDDPAGAAATAGVVNGPFRPGITVLGARHPVTADLPGWRPDGPASWGRWYRRLAAEDLHGQVLMDTGGDGTPATGSSPAGGAAPLLLLDRVGAGRVALLLSDQIWLWARGHDGGGPQAELLRRIAHWLMKQPDLEENALTARIGPGEGGQPARLIVTRRSTDPDPATTVTVTVTDPAGARQIVALRADTLHGTATGETAAALPGVWQASDGQRTAYAAAAAGNPREVEDLRATAERLAPVIRAGGGSVHALDPAGLPELRRIGAGRAASGRDWIGLPMRDGHMTTAIDETRLLPDWLALALLLGAVVLAWWRESL